MQNRLTFLGAGSLLLTIMMIGCQGADPAGPELGSDKAALSKGVDDKGTAKDGWSLADSCFPGRGTALPENCGTGSKETVGGTVGASLPADVPIRAETPIKPDVNAGVTTGGDTSKGDTASGDSDGQWNLSDPCFPGRGGPLPENCGG